MKIFSTTSLDSALKCHRVNEIITRQFKSAEDECPYIISTFSNEKYLRCSYDTALKCC